LLYMSKVGSSGGMMLSRRPTAPFSRANDLKDSMILLPRPRPLKGGCHFSSI